jgi:hypothetical protein
MIGSETVALSAPLALATPQATLGTAAPNEWPHEATLVIVVTLRREGRIHPALRLWLSRELVLLDSFALCEDNLVVFNLVSHHLKFVAHPKEGYPCSGIGAVTSKAAASVGLLSEIGLVHHHLPHSSRGILPAPLHFCWPKAPGSIAVSFMGEPQAVHCGPWVCLSSMACAPSVRRPEFSGKPTSRVRFEGIRCSDAYLDVIALGAFEQPVFEADGARRHAFQHHPRLATGTARALNGGQEISGLS